MGLGQHQHLGCVASDVEFRDRQGADREDKAKRKEDEEYINTVGSVSQSEFPANFSRCVAHLNQEHRSVDEDERQLDQNHQRTIFGSARGQQSASK
eukprot:1777820-Prymnesium_polylepis.1